MMENNIEKAIKYSKKEISTKAIELTFNRLRTLKEKKAYVDNKVSELEEYSKDLGRLNQRVLFQLIFMKPNHRKKVFKERLPIFIQIKIKESLYWLKDKKKALSKIKEYQPIELKFHWLGNTDELKKLYNKLRKYYLHDDTTYELFRQHFYLDSDDAKELTYPKEKLIWQKGKQTGLIMILKILCNPQKYTSQEFRKVTQISNRSFIENIKPKVIMSVFVLQNEVKIKEGSLNTILNRTLKKPRQSVIDDFKDIFGELST